MVRPEYQGPALKVVHFDGSSYPGRLDRKVPFNLSLLSSVPLFCILLTRTITKRGVAWVGSVQPECTVSLDFLKTGIFGEWKGPLVNGQLDSEFIFTFVLVILLISSSSSSSSYYYYHYCYLHCHYHIIIIIEIIIIIITIIIILIIIIIIIIIDIIKFVMIENHHLIKTQKGK